MKIFYSAKHLLHDTTHLVRDGYPYAYEETPDRAEAILSAVQQARLGPISEPTDHGTGPIQQVHAPDFLAYLQNVYQDSADFYNEPGPVYPETFALHSFRRKPKRYALQRGVYGFGTGTVILEGTWQAAYWSAQCALSAADEVRQGRTAYAVCRPPGHHALADMYGGLCYLNNAAIAARSLEPPVAILDIDYHHGNGTQEIFYSDPSVLYCSLHAHPDEDYPYFWGEADETGEGAGLGFNHNWPLPKNTTDELYLEALDQALDTIRAFQPRYLVLSAGLDMMEGDPIGNLHITQAGLSEIARRIASLKLPTAIIQEGGYLVDKLGENAVTLLREFAYQTGI